MGGVYGKVEDCKTPLTVRRRAGGHLSPIPERIGEREEAEPPRSNAGILES
jgi:hypothetical protein